MTGTETIRSCSPGRINLIGEHTDYNNGFVLPAAIDKAAYVALRLRTDDQIILTARDFKDTYSTSLDAVRPSPKGWPNYMLGVVDQLLKAGRVLHGFEAEVWGDIPVGAGLSSSAAVECAMLIALNESMDFGLDRLEMARIAQQAEHAFAGVKVGIMDMFASLFGKTDHVIRLDCRSLDYTYVPFRANGHQLVLLDTGVHHSLASSEYNVRREQCEKGVSLVHAKHPEVRSLRDATVAQLRACVEPVDAVVYKRCLYIVEENARLMEACANLERGDLASFGQRLYATHEGLSRLYEVSCPELDFLVDRAREFPGVLGARMMGGGFGGCTLNLVREEAVPGFTKALGEAYRKQMGKEMKNYIARISEGGRLL